MVLMGASGDLSKRMVVPALFRLSRSGILPAGFRLVGYARDKWTDDEFRKVMREAVLANARAGDEEAWPAFAAGMSYVPPDVNGDDERGYAWIGDRLARNDAEAGTGGRHLFYLAVPPAAIKSILDRLSATGLAGHGYRPPEGGWAHVIVEKPFGRSLETAQSLNRDVATALDEHDVYRIDHFLGKEAAQNLFAFRFGNGIFEPVWNRNYIDHVQITAAETLGTEGRGSYYESAGALRDMLQSHLLQLMSLVALEPPPDWTPDLVRNEKAQVLQSIREIRPEDVDRVAVRGQYAGYREEKDVAPDSNVETFAALELYVDNWRWAGVPFFLRSGKRLAQRITEVNVVFKPAPHSMFEDLGGQRISLEPNVLTLRVTPNDALFLEVEGKQPGQGMGLRPVLLDYSGIDPKEIPSAYEYLLLDAMRGKTTLFARADEVEASWALVQPVLDHWERTKAADFPNYAPGTWGPAAADELIARGGRRWRDFKLEAPDCP
jgi:glucose-6-phosphate 1-dehydrogenase